jgi:hypothetical protein
MPAIWGRTNNIAVIATAISSLRLGRFNAAHNAKLAAKKEIESLPNAEDQKLMDGRKTISKDRILMFFEQVAVRGFMLT